MEFKILSRVATCIFEIVNQKLWITHLSAILIEMVTLVNTQAASSLGKTKEVSL